MGFNQAAGLAMANNDRSMGSEKMHTNAMNGTANGDQASFPSVPFFLPALNGAALQNMANSNIHPNASAERSNPLQSQCQSDAPAKQRDAPSTNRNSNYFLTLISIEILGTSTYSYIESY